MEKSKHTPGPWKTSRAHDGIRIEATDGNSLGTVWGQNENANARLIVASPEMLEVLEAQTYFLESLLINTPDWRDRMKVTEQGYTSRANDIIAKAKGE